VEKKSAQQLNTSNDGNTVAGKCILITGAAKRVGAVIAEVLHQAGANIIIHCRHSRQHADLLAQRLNQQRANSAAVVTGDLSRQDQLNRLVEQAHQQWHRLDALINNASSFFPTAMGTVDDRQWQDLMDSNLRAPFFLSQAAMPYLKASYGCIINIVDIHADRPLAGHSVYCMAKAGLAMMTRSLACELGPEIRVNAVAPGAILWPSAEAGAAELSDQQKQRIVEKTFLKRQGKPEDIAATILFLIRDAHYITGQIVNVDGGRSLNT